VSTCHPTPDAKAVYPIVTTERYDNQKPEALMAAAKLLETGETFNIPSSSDTDAASENPNQHADADDNSLTQLEKGFGVSDGDRTRDFRSHSPALCP
jgi:hypothetical protein